MSQAVTSGVETNTMDPCEIGWYIESADEETYGPVTRQAIRRFLEDQTITPNTLVRHCTQPEAKPVADQPSIMQQPQPGSEGVGRRRSALPRPGLARNAISKPWPKDRSPAPGTSSLPFWSARGAMLRTATSAAPGLFGSSSSFADAARPASTTVGSWLSWSITWCFCICRCS